MNYSQLAELRQDYNSADGTQNTQVTDEVYDALHSHYMRTDGTTDPERIRPAGGEVALDYPMPSLDKVKGESAVSDLTKILQRIRPPFLLSDKLDGSSLQIKYQDGNIYITTGGDGVTGHDISEIQNYISLPRLTENIVVRGEIVISNENFETVAPKLRERGLKATNSRNLVNGVVNKKTMNPEIVEKCDIVVYDIMSEPETSILERYNKLESLGFNVVEWEVLDPNTDEEYIKFNESRTNPSLEDNATFLIDYLTKYREQRIDNTKYRIDGIVVASIPDSRKPVTAENPDYMFAFKVDTCVVTTVTKIEWKLTSRHGKLTPVVYVEPVDILGTTISKATGHNAKFVWDHGLGAGAEIVIKYAGDVIPKVVYSLKKVTPMSPAVKCEWNSTGVDLYCVNPDAFPEVAIAKMAYFIRTLGIKHCGDSFLQKAHTHGIDDIGKLVRIRSEDIQQMERHGEKSAGRIINEIRNALQNIDYPSLMAATGIFGRGCGKQVMEKFVSQFRTWEFDTLTEEYILNNGHGFGPVKSKAIAEGLPIFKQWIIDHPECVPKVRTVMAATQDLVGEVILLTGTTDASLKESLKARGATIKEGYSREITMLIAVDVNSTSGKMSKAKARNKEFTDKGLPPPIKIVAYSSFSKGSNNRSNTGGSIEI